MDPALDDGVLVTTAAAGVWPQSAQSRTLRPDRPD